jgi:acylphosphatase
MSEIPEPNIVRWIISGKVQGVGFRRFVSRCARAHELCGDVRNLPDGRVEVRATGTMTQLTALRDDLIQGPPAARVDSVEQSAPDPSLSFDGFEIRH